MRGKIEIDENALQNLIAFYLIPTDIFPDEESLRRSITRVVMRAISNENYSIIDSYVKGIKETNKQQKRVIDNILEILTKTKFAKIL